MASFDPRPVPCVNPYDFVAQVFMLTRPDLKFLSLDEWLLQHRESLTPSELRLGEAILLLHLQHADTVVDPDVPAVDAAPPFWSVIVTRDITESCVIRVRAETQADAAAEALDILPALDAPGWAVDDGSGDNSDPYVTACEPALDVWMPAQVGWAVRPADAETMQVLHDIVRETGTPVVAADAVDPVDACDRCGNTLNDGSDICDQCGGSFVSRADKPADPVQRVSASPAEIEAARDIHWTDEVEIDDDAWVSRTDEGYWVSAWVWVPAETSDDAGTEV